MAELKPCPFCGSSAEIVRDEIVKKYGYEDHYTVIRCCNFNCGVTLKGKSVKALQKAFKLWSYQIRLS